MNALQGALRLAVESLSDGGHLYALVGGLAVSIRSEPRFTKDVDLALKVDGDRQAERVVHGLVQSGFRIHASLEQVATGRLATVRLGAPDDTTEIVVDLLFASSGIEPEVVDDAEPFEAVPDLWLPVASVAGLVTMKLVSADPLRRPNDLADLQGLAKRLTAQDLKRVGQLAQLVTERGTGRGRDLKQCLQDWVMPFVRL